MPREYRLILKYADEPGYTPDIDCYLRHGGYDSLKKALAVRPKELSDAKSMSGPKQIRDEVKISGLRDRDGAGYTSGMKWYFVDRKNGMPIELISNAHQLEPVTFQASQHRQK